MGLMTLQPVFNAVTVASLLSILLLMDQPLFQRGIRVNTHPAEQRGNMSVPITQSPLQRGATGITPDHDFEPKLFHPLFAQVAREYQNRDPIKLVLPGCHGRCELTVIAPGWDVECVEWKTPYRFMNYPDYEAWTKYKWNETTVPYDGPLRESEAFRIATTYGEHLEMQDPFYHSSYHINTNVMYKATKGANGTMHWRNCTLTEALVRYPVEISNDTLTLMAMPAQANRTMQKIFRYSEHLGNAQMGMSSHVAQSC